MKSTTADSPNATVNAYINYRNNLSLPEDQPVDIFWAGFAAGRAVAPTTSGEEFANWLEELGYDQLAERFRLETGGIA